MIFGIMEIMLVLFPSNLFSQFPIRSYYHWGLTYRLFLQKLEKDSVTFKSKLRFSFYFPSYICQDLILFYLDFACLSGIPSIILFLVESRIRFTCGMTKYNRVIPGLSYFNNHAFCYHKYTPLLNFTQELNSFKWGSNYLSWFMNAKQKLKYHSRAIGSVSKIILQRISLTFNLHLVVAHWWL